ncbi:MAG: enoyl-CoA hydratase-related protein [Alphaproteobacteria bacterium]|nr:enoyl-CoA hydratase-related protein [Alphaproteobacteria bacterium]MCL2504818.1 enoyl-CoA hydratase-related protein [Alphaproteobacteria bacterium]
MSSEVIFDQLGSVLFINFNRPSSKNAMDTTMANLLSNKLKAVASDRSIRAIVLRGSGENFMDGFDLSGYVVGATSAQEQIFQKIQFFYSSIRELATMERPVIASLDGAVSGAGLSFLLVSDIVIASDRVSISSNFLSHALLPDGGVSFFLPRKIGLAKANELLLLEKQLTAADALGLGLINKVVPAADLEIETLELAKKLADGPTRSIGLAKRLLNASFEQNLQSQLSQEASMWSAVAKTFDFKEGVNAFHLKKEPRYTGA